MRAALPAFLALLLIAAAPMQPLPEPVRAAMAEHAAACRDMGGRPAPTPDYHTRADLNGDGRPDHIIDLAGLNCNGAPSAFCGSAGCPVSVFLSGPGGYRAVNLGHVQGWRLDRTGPRPALVLDLHGSSCGRAGYRGCQRRWAADVAAAPPPRPSAAQPAAPSPRSEPRQAAARPGQWRLHTPPDAPPSATADGPGVIRQVALLCRDSTATAAFVLRARPPQGAVILSWSMGSDRFDLPLSQHPDGGDIWYADVSRTALPWVLANRRGNASIRINGGLQGTLPVSGAGPMVRAALEPCHRF